MTTEYQHTEEVTGTPRWGLARDIVAQLRQMPAATAEAETEVRLYNIRMLILRTHSNTTSPAACPQNSGRPRHSQPPPPMLL